MKLIIGLTGNAGAGKDFTFTTLKRYRSHMGEFFRIGLADGVKFDIQEVLDVRSEDLGGAYAARIPALWNKPYKPEVRALLQMWGTDLRRAVDPDYWLKHAQKRIDALPDGSTAVITDVRFPNEGRWVQDMGGIVVNILASPQTRARRLGVSLEELEHMSQHPSEAEVRNVVANRVVWNDNEVEGRLAQDICEIWDRMVWDANS